MDTTRTENGGIELVLAPQFCTKKEIDRILKAAEKDSPGEATLRLVGYKDGERIAKLAMVQDHVLGERPRLVSKLREIFGVMEAR